VSVTYSIPCNCDDGFCDHMVNVANENARFIAFYLDLGEWEYGQIRGKDLKVRCLQAIDNISDVDGGTEDESPHPRVVIMGRPPGYFKHRFENLLKLAELAGDLGVVRWS